MLRSNLPETISLKAHRKIRPETYLYICTMKPLEGVIKILQRLKPELKQKYAVSSIGLFGSIVRDDFSPFKSDIDIVVEFSRPIGIEFVDLAEFLESKVKSKVDLVSKSGIREKYLREIELEIINV